ncbi:ParB/RepB/Spo0J family partition protein [Frigoriglobus tundricola]|uniref:Chromosome (Plasmid) partitioning protein ParB n=1 Tax=Frigoriglobus tundricola TaxID=2774151 RepID=A0A6M5YN73_9BACT|nr:ParB/RepB/Spo0J family partition protein [Frigoriglobus tundricola]QJW95415.1 Chromosome (plasmid) partitioning protein ParB [Frigoriglobus tundricola]
MSSADKFTKKYGSNLNESLGARTAPAIPAVSSVAAPATVGPDDGRTRARETGHMEIERIVPDPNQPRKEFDTDALDRLAASIQRHGQLQPIRVRWNGSLGKWVIIAGERRYQAAKRAGMRTLVCVFVDRDLTPTEILSEQIVENLLREDLKPIEQAKAYKTLMELNGWSGSQLAEALNVSKATVSRVLPLLSLPAEIKAQVDKGDLPATIAYELTKLPTAEGQQAMAGRIVAERFTRAEAIEAVRQEVDQAGTKASATPPPAVPESAPEFRRETAKPNPSFAAKLPDEVSTHAAGGDAPVQDAAPVVEPAPTAVTPAPPAKKKPGKPRTGTKENVYRVEGARVVVSFLKKVPEPGEIVAALEQALAKARADLQSRSAA